MIDDEAEVRWDMAGPRWVARIAGGRTGSRITGACGALVCCTGNPCEKSSD